LQPIFLLLLTGIAFAMLGSALERILNPRIIEQAPSVEDRDAGRVNARRRRGLLPVYDRRVLAGFFVGAIVLAIFIPAISRRTLANSIRNDLNPSPVVMAGTPTPVIASTSTDVPATITESIPTLTQTATIPPTPTTTATPVTLEPTLTPALAAMPPATYLLQRGEFPYCIARRFNVDPSELLTLSGLRNQSTFFAGTILTIPLTGNPFPGERRLLAHPAIYTVSASNETFHGIACQFGDLDPAAIAQVNQISVDSPLFVGQQLNIP
jgi:LysM repeat protein